MIERIKDPVLVVGCPRSGSSLLFNLLSEAPSLWSIGYESKAILERYHPPSAKGWESGALEAEDLTPVSRIYILQEFARQAAPGTFWRQVNRIRGRLRTNSLWQRMKLHGQTVAPGSAMSSALPGRALELIRRLVRLRNSLLPLGVEQPIRLLEKTPENCLRLPFLEALFPDARVIYLVRDGRANVSSLIEGWRQPYLFTGYQVPIHLDIPGVERGRWAFTLIPGWRELSDRPLEEVCAWQWVRCNEAVLMHRERTRLPYLTVHFEDLIADKEGELGRIAAFIGIDYASELSHLSRELPPINILTAPGPGKWRRQNPEAIERVLPILTPVMQRLGYPEE